MIKETMYLVSKEQNFFKDKRTQETVENYKYSFLMPYSQKDVEKGSFGYKIHEFNSKLELSDSLVTSDLKKPKEVTVSYEMNEQFVKGAGMVFKRRLMSVE